MGLFSDARTKAESRGESAAAAARVAFQAGDQTYVLALEGKVTVGPSLKGTGQVIDAIEREGWRLDHTTTAAWNSDKHERRALILTCVFRRHAG